jgi:hypothetical protein
VIPLVTYPRNFSPVTWEKRREPKSLKVLKIKNLKGSSRLEKILTNWKHTATRHKKTFHQDLKKNLEVTTYLCSLLHVSIEVTRKAFFDKEDNGEEDVKPLLKAAFYLEDPVLLVSQDESKKIQAVALHDKKTNELHYLVSNPKNLIYRGTSRACRGAGSSIIEHLARKTLKHVLPLNLKASPSAKKFYLKHHFEIIPSPYSAPFALLNSASSLAHMRLTAEKISEKFTRSCRE